MKKLNTPRLCATVLSAACSIKMLRGGRSQSKPLPSAAHNNSLSRAKVRRGSTAAAPKLRQLGLSDNAVRLAEEAIEGPVRQSRERHHACLDMASNLSALFGSYVVVSLADLETSLSPLISDRISGFPQIIEPDS